MAAIELHALHNFQRGLCPAQAGRAAFAALAKFGAAVVDVDAIRGAELLAEYEPRVLRIDSSTPWRKPEKSRRLVPG